MHRHQSPGRLGHQRRRTPRRDDPGHLLGGRQRPGGAHPVNHTTLPNNSLFRVNPHPGSHYFVETDPRFASYLQWLSSDYLLGALSLDPALTQKRLGDGFYEQKLIREQVTELTGRRFLDTYQSDEEQYKALMNAGVTFAQQYKCAPASP